MSHAAHAAHGGHTGHAGRGGPTGQFGQSAHVAYVALGSNLGPRARLFERALAWLERDPGVRVTDRSDWIESAPMGPAQPPFLNGVVRVETDYPPEVLLALLKRVERLAGRRRAARWGPRTLDLDLLLYDDRVVRRRHLTVPHPGLERPFVQAPLAQVRDRAGAGAPG